MRLFSLIIILISTIGQLAAQKEPINVPLPWENAVRYDQSEESYYWEGNRYKDYKEVPDKKLAKKGPRWNVFSTRNDVPILDKPSGTQKATASFSQMFYVTAISGNYLEVQDKLDGSDITGWCHKDDLILWKKPLADKTTGIDLKAFMVNNLLSKEVLRKIRDDKENYQIYDGPGKDAKLLDARMIYDVFFVFKYENPSGTVNGGRFLVSQFYTLGGVAPLMGWVDESRTRLWRTMLCLEPNFDQQALAERNKNGIMATVFPESFGGETQVEIYRETGNGGSALVKGKLRDPALGDFQKVDRMYGNIFRYPVFQGSKLGDNNSRIQTGVTGKTNVANTGAVEGFDDEVYTRLSKTRDELSSEMNRENIVFVLDGSNGMKGYHKLVANVLNGLHDRNASEGITTSTYTAVVYKNEFNQQSFEKNPESDFCQILGPNNNAKKIAEELESYRVGEGGDDSEYEAVNYALKKAIGFMKPNQTNVIIHIGNAPDNSEDFTWKSVKSGTLITANNLADLLTKDVDIHYINFVSFTNEVHPSTRELFYSETAERLLPEFSTAQKNKYAGISFVKDFKQPATPKAVSESTSEYKMTRMSESPFQFKSFLMKDYHLKLVEQYIKLEIDSCKLRTAEFLKSLNLVVEDESSLKDRADDFSSPILELILNSFIEEGKGDEQFLREFRDWCSKAKVHIFVPSLTYYRSDKLQEPLFKYVLFMHDSQLYNKIADLRRLVNSLEDGSAETQKALAEHWKKVAEETMGGGGKYSNMTVEELHERMLGVEKMDLILPNIFGMIGGKTIKDIENSKGFTSAELQPLIDYFSKSLRSLEGIYNGSEYYKIPNTATKFYWVPLEFVFG